MYHHFFIRHLCTDKNLPEYNASEELQDKVLSTDNEELPVNEEGHKQGKLLEQYFGPYLQNQQITGKFDFIHSGYKRTRITLEYILKGIKDSSIEPSAISVDERIKDVDHGEANDIPYEKVREEFPNYAKQIDRVGYLDAVPPEGEAHRQALKRIRSYLEDLKEKKNHTITVTHLSTLVMIRWVLEGLSDDEVLELLSANHPPNGSATHYAFDPEKNKWKVLEVYKEPWDI